MSAPVISIHFALAGPMSWTSRKVSGSGAMKPNFATGMPNFARRTAIRKSQEAATMQPLPTAWPWIIAITGCGTARSADCSSSQPAS